MPYQNMLRLLRCKNCAGRNTCFLQRMPLQNYPETTQSFVIHLPRNAFSYDNYSRRWYTNDWSIANQIIANYEAQNGFILENRQYPLSTTAQKESDRQFIRKKFKHLLEIAAKATEDTAPEASIIFDGIGLVLASDYLEAVHKILSMFSTYGKMIDANKASCPNYSTNP